MQNYVIKTDSTSDLSPKLVSELGVEVLPLHFNIDGKNYADYPDRSEMDMKQFYDLLRKGQTSTTSQINPEDFIKAFSPNLENGQDILYIAFSSGLSGTYASAKIAAEELLKSYPERKIRVVDSLCASMGQGLLVYYAVKHKEGGKSIDELKEWLNHNKLKVCHWITVDDLHHLHRGGRVSSASAFLGSMLNIKPILHVDNEGHLILVNKTRGRQRAVDVLLAQMEKTAIDLQDQTIFISHGDCEDEVMEMVSDIKKRFKVKNIEVNMIGPVIGSHSGPGTIALFFIGTQR